MSTPGWPSVQLAHVGGVSDVLRYAKAAEAAGFRRVWVAETNGPDAIVAASVLAVQTGLEVGTSILPVMSRSPVVLAMAAADLSQLSGRPVHLGVGIGGQAIVEQWHGERFDHPSQRVRDSLAIVRQALAGERTGYDGLRSSHGFRLSGSPAAPVLLYVGGMGPRMLELAAQEADGLIVTWCSPRVVSERRAQLDAAARKAGRPDGAVRLVARAYVFVSDDAAQVARTRELVAHELTDYVASPPYGAYFRSIGYGSETDAVQAGVAARDRAASRRGVSDAMLEELLVVGSADRCGRRIAEFFDAGADDVVLQVVAASRGGDVEGTIDALGRWYSAREGGAPDEMAGAPPARATATSRARTEARR